MLTGVAAAFEVGDVEDQIQYGIRRVAVHVAVAVVEDFAGFQLVGYAAQAFRTTGTVDIQFDDGLALPIGEGANAFPAVTGQFADKFVQDFPNGFVDGIGVDFHG